MSATYQSRIPCESPSSYGLGDDAGKVESLLWQLTESTYETVSLGKPKKDAMDHLYKYFCASCEPEWEVCGASAVSFEAYLKAEKFIQALPTSFPVPEVAVDPDGEISLEWYRGSGRVFSVSIGPGDDLSYAGLFGPNKVHGTETFNAAIPKVVLENIRRLHACV
jgi:hypothetical protein